MRYKSTAALAACILLLIGCGGGGDQSGSGERAIPLAAAPSDSAMTVKLSVLSSAPEFVSGGDARIHLRAAPGLRDKLVLLLNGQPVNVTLKEVADGLEGVVTGLRNGDNLLQVKHGNVRDSITLTNWPITGPMFTGPQQTPFVCTTIQSAVNRQPLVDSPTAPGYKVANAAGSTIGYSRNCSIETFVSYSYRNTSGALSPLPADGSRPADMSTATLADGRVVDFVIRREIGSINRFLYSIAMLAPMPAADTAAQDDTRMWNGKLLYWFQGGVAIGHSQGTVHGGSMNLDVLGLGWAIVHSSGNNTGTHYNMNLAGETALMTKERFIERYGVPLYTVGLGGSGGAIQQYLIAQNHPGVLNGLLPVQSYPDMVTQTIHVGDCELLEHYMDATDRTNAKWRVTKNRTWLVGMNAEQDDVGNNAKVNDALAPLKVALGYSTAKGSTECVPAWRGLTPLAMNPLLRAGAELAVLRAAKRHRCDPLDALRRPAQCLWRRCHRRSASDLGQRRRAVRPELAEGRQDHAGGVRAPELEHRRLEAPEPDGSRGLPVLRYHGGRDPEGADDSRLLRPVEPAQPEPRHRECPGAANGR